MCLRGALYTSHASSHCISLVEEEDQLQPAIRGEWVEAVVAGAAKRRCKERYAIRSRWRVECGAVQAVYRGHASRHRCCRPPSSQFFPRVMGGVTITNY